MAVAVLVLFALTGPRGSGEQTRLHSNALSRWAQTARPAITGLFDDSKAIERDTSPALAVPIVELRDDALQYEQNLAAVQALGTPPDPAIAQAWRTTLQQLATAELVVDKVRPSDQAEMAQAHVRFAAAEAELLGIEQEMPARP